MAGTSDIKELLTRNVRSSGIYIAFVFIIVLFAILTDGALLSPGNLTNLVLQYSYILILAIGMVLIIVAGHIDLSVGSVVALTGAVAAVVVIGNGLPWWVGVLAALATGVLVGLWQGFWVAYVGIPAFIVTLAGMLIFRGLTMQVLGNVSLSPFPKEYQYISGGFLNGLLGGDGYDAFTLFLAAALVVVFAIQEYRGRLAKLKYKQQVEAFPLFWVKIAAVGIVVMAFAWQLAHSRGLPVVLMLLAALVVVFASQTYRGRCAMLMYRQQVEAFPLFWVKIAAVGIVVMAFAWQLAHSRGLPVVLILLAALVLIYGFVSQRTIFGRHIYA